MSSILLRQSARICSQGSDSYLSELHTLGRPQEEASTLLVLNALQLCVSVTRACGTRVDTRRPSRTGTGTAVRWLGYWVLSSSCSAAAANRKCLPKALSFESLR